MELDTVRILWIEAGRNRVKLVLEEMGLALEDTHASQDEEILGRIRDAP